MNNSIVAGVDIGGSHITVALVDMHSHKIIEHTWRRFCIDAGGIAAAIISDWCVAIKDSFKANNLTPGSLGIAMPGPFNYEQGISLMQNQSKYDALYGLNVKKLLADALAISKSNIVMANDAACFLQGEIFGGVAKGNRNILGLTLGTGLGSSLAIDGKVWDADLWHTPFKKGIAEDYLSNRWFVKRYRELSGEEVKNVKELAQMIPVNKVAQQVFDEFGENLGTFLLPLTKKHHIDMVVLGGNIAQAFILFKPTLEQLLIDESILEIKQSLLGERAALLGAASYCLRKDNFTMQINGS